MEAVYVDWFFICTQAAVSLFISEATLLLNFFTCTPRRQQEAELKLLEEETSKRVEEAIRTKVEESLNSVEIKVEIQRQLEEGRKKLLTEVAALLEKEKEAALIEARNKEVIIRLPCCFCLTSHFLFLLW